MDESDRTASLMSPARLAQMKSTAAATPAAWLTKMAADAGHVHVKRIGELGEVLQEQATSAELATAASQLERLAASLPTLDFALLEPRGWWARITGKSGTSAPEFAEQFERIAKVTGALTAVASGLRREQQADAALAERALVELEVQCRAVEQIIDQGSRWLQDMRTQLKLRHAAAVDVAAQDAVREDASRCDTLVARLKLLRSLCNATAQVPVQARANAQRRLALAQTLQQSLASEVKDWHGRLSVLAAAASSGKRPASDLQRQMEAHQELQVSVDKAASACQQLLQQERALVQSLVALSRPQAPPT